jgi:hypothetical protein
MPSGKTEADRCKSAHSHWRLKWYPIAVLVGLFLSLIILFFTSFGSKYFLGRIGGDFAAFYSSGQIIGKYGFEELYNINRQAELQKSLLSSHEVVLPFAYPPFVALICYPLSLLSFRDAYTVCVFCNLVAVLITLAIIRTEQEWIERYFCLGILFSLTFYPLFRSIFGGQNTPLTMMLIALVWKSVIRNRLSWAGIFLGAMLLKPQFAVPIVGLLFVSGNIRVAITAGMVGVIIVIISGLYMGVDTYFRWFEFLRWFAEYDAMENKHNAVSWIGFLDSCFGIKNTLAIITGYALSLLTIIVTVLIWRYPESKVKFDDKMGIAIVSLLLIPPHVMYYDVGLIVMSLSMSMGRIKQDATFFVSIWLFGLTQIFGVDLGFSPLFFLVLSIFIIQLYFIIMPDQFLRKVIV